MEKRDRRTRKIVPPRHNHSPILQRRLHRVIPPSRTPPISRPSLEDRKLLLEIAVDERQKREHRQQDIRHERRDHRRERRRESTQLGKGEKAMSVLRAHIEKKD